MVEPQALQSSSPDQTAQNSPGRDEPSRFYPIRHQKLKHWIAVPTGILLVLVAIVSLVYGFITTWSAIERHGRAVILKTLPLPLLIFTLAAILGLAILIRTARHWRDGVMLNNEGISVRRGKKETALSWDNITQLNALINVVKFAPSVVDVRTKAVLEDNQGQRVQITDRFENAQDLVQQIREKVLPSLHQQTLRALRQGEEVAFHRQLTAQKQGLLIRNKPHKWETMGLVMKRRKISLLEKTTQRELINLPIRKLANIDILMALLENPPR